jgi:hypothetical protein
MKLKSSQQILKEIALEKAKRDEVLETLYTQEFRSKFELYNYLGKHLEYLSQPHFFQEMFQKSEPAINIGPIFRLLEERTATENQREGGKIHAIYSYQNSFTFPESTQIEIINNTKKPSPALKQALKKNGIDCECIADIEFIERVPMHVETKSNLQELIIEYYEDPRLERSFIEESIRGLRMMQEVEKLHTMFAVGKQIIPVYVGVGTNQPYKLSEKTQHGKNRYYRLDLQDEKSFEQTSTLQTKPIPPKDLEYLLRNCDFSYGDPMIDGTTISTGLLVGKRQNNVLVDDEGHEFGEMDEERYLGNFQIKGKELKKLILKQESKEGKTEDKIREIIQKRKTGTILVQEQLQTLHPEFERYSMVFYDPFRIIHALGLWNTIFHLAKHNLLDSGFLNIQNLASDLYINGFPAEKRMRGISLLAMNYINNGKYEELIRKTAQQKYTRPL